MNRTVKIRVSGQGGGTDAPSVEDVLEQIKDFVDILRGVEEAIAGEPNSALDWRVVDAHRNSPLEFDLQAFPKDFGVNIDRRVNLVTNETAKGLALLQSRAERPRYFTNPVIRKARRAFERVKTTAGLNFTEVDFGEELPKVQVTPTLGRIATGYVDLILERPAKPHQEIGSIEGYLQGIARGAYNRRVAYVVERVTGEPVRCVVTTEAAPELEGHEIRDVWRYRRVGVWGKIYYSGEANKIDRVEASQVRFLRGRSDLPQLDDVIDPSFTGGMRSEDYLEGIRNGAPS